MVFESIIFNTTEVAEAVLNQYVEWSPEAAIALQESVFRGELVSFCLSDEGVSDSHRLYFGNPNVLIRRTSLIARRKFYWTFSVPMNHQSYVLLEASASLAIRS